ncbi:MAG: hypothetical protein IT225_05965 [Flavobacteriales bacterium]|jgi:hypothetical protein|nr:hypothetical protein [Flavobacteriales bacterium]
MRDLTAFLFAIMATTLASGQRAGTLRLLVDPGHNFEFVLDHKYRMQQREVRLSEGLHHFSIWAPERIVLDTNVFVVADRTGDLVVKLPFSTEYATYRNDLSAYQSARRARVWTPVLVGMGLAWTGLSYGRYNTVGDDLDEAVAAYHSSDDPGVINRIKEEVIPDHNAALRRARTSLVAGSIFTMASVGYMVYTRIRTSGMEQPRFEDKERIRFEGLTWVPDRNGAYWAAGFTIPIQR